MKRGNVFERARKVLVVARVIAGTRGIPRSAWYLLGATAKGICRIVRDLLLDLYSALSGKTLVHVIGDSHSKAFRGHLPFVVHHLGAATAHNLKKKNSTTHSREKLFDEIERVRGKGIVVLVFGEIDCRIHAYYQFKKSNEERTISEILDLSISNYGEVIEEIRASGIEPCILSVAPATTVDNEYNFPFYAAPELRAQITRMFNEKLSALCREKGYNYLDIYPVVSDENGMMKTEYAADRIHLNGRIVGLVRDELRRKLGARV